MTATNRSPAALVACVIGITCVMHACGTPPGANVPVIAENVVLASASASSSFAPRESEFAAVPAPKDLWLAIHLARPVDTLHALHPIIASVPVFQQRSLADFYVSLAFGWADADIVDLDLPIDIAAINDASDGTNAVVALALKRDPATLDLLQERFEITTANGVRRLRPKGPHTHEGPMECILAASWGIATERIICSSSARARSLLVPYLTRTMPRLENVSDIHFEVLRIPAESKRRKGDPDDDDPVPGSDDPRRLFAGNALMTLAGEVSGISGDLRFTNGEAALTAQARFTNAKSPLARALLSQATPAGPPPGAWSRLPPDVMFGLAARGARSEDLVPLRDGAVDAFRKHMIADAFTAADVQSPLDALSSIALTGGPLVFAGGFDRTLADKELGQYVQLTSTAQATESARAKARLAGTGYYLAAVEEPAAKWIDAFKRFAAFDQKFATKKPGPVSVQDAERFTHSLHIVPSAATLPRGTLHLEDRVRPNPLYRLHDRSDDLAHTTHVFIAPEGSRTWIAWGEREALVTEKLRFVTSAPASNATPSKAVDTLNRATLSSGGFITFAGLWVLIDREGAMAERLAAMREQVTHMLQLSSQVDIPLFVTARQTASGNGGTIDLSARVQLTAFADPDRIAPMFE